MTSYRVVVEFDGNAWTASVPNVAGAHTYSRTREGLEHEVREAIALVQDIDDEGSFDLEWDFRDDS